MVLFYTFNIRVTADDTAGNRRDAFSQRTASEYRGSCSGLGNGPLIRIFTRASKRFSRWWGKTLRPVPITQGRRNLSFGLSLCVLQLFLRGRSRGGRIEAQCPEEIEPEAAFWLLLFTFVCFVDFYFFVWQKIIGSVIVSTSGTQRLRLVLLLCRGVVQQAFVAVVVTLVRGYVDLGPRL